MVTNNARTCSNKSIITYNYLKEKISSLNKETSTLLSSLHTQHTKIKKKKKIIYFRNLVNHRGIPLVVIPKIIRKKIIGNSN